MSLFDKTSTPESFSSLRLADMCLWPFRAIFNHHIIPVHTGIDWPGIGSFAKIPTSGRNLWCGLHAMANSIQRLPDALRNIIYHNLGLTNAEILALAGNHEIALGQKLHAYLMLNQERYKNDMQKVLGSELLAADSEAATADNFFDYKSLRQLFADLLPEHDTNILIWGGAIDNSQTFKCEPLGAYISSLGADQLPIAQRIYRALFNQRDGVEMMRGKCSISFAQLSEETYQQKIAEQVDYAVTEAVSEAAGAAPFIVAAATRATAEEIVQGIREHAPYKALKAAADRAVTLWWSNPSGVHYTALEKLDAPLPRTTPASVNHHFWTRTFPGSLLMIALAPLTLLIGVVGLVAQYIFEENHLATLDTDTYFTTQSFLDYSDYLPIEGAPSLSAHKSSLSAYHQHGNAIGSSNLTETEFQNTPKVSLPSP